MDNLSVFNYKKLEAKCNSLLQTNDELVEVISELETENTELKFKITELSSKQAGRKPISEETLQEIFSLKNTGFTITEISSRLGITRQTVWKYLRKRSS